MRSKMFCICICLLLIVVTIVPTNTQAQAQKYTLQSREESFQPLTGDFVTNLIGYGLRYGYPLVSKNFHFSYFGRAIDTLLFNDNGYLFFREDQSDFGYPVYTTGLRTLATSGLSFFVDSSSAQKILKIEWINAGFVGDPTGTDSMTVQVWLYDNTSVIEMHYGASSVAKAHYSAIFGQAPGDQIAIANNWGKAKQEWFNVSGTSAKDAKLVFKPNVWLALSTVPKSGSVFTLTPTISNRVDGASTLPISMYPSIVNRGEKIYLAGIARASKVVIANELGEIVGTISLAPDNTIGTNNLPAGAYFVRTVDGQVSSKFIVR